MTDARMASDSGEKRKGMTAYTLIAACILVIGLLIGISASNYNTYKLRKSGNQITVWKGKFSPRDAELAESFQPLNVGDTDITELTRRNFVGKDSVYRALFRHYMAQIGAEYAEESQADLTRIDGLLDEAETLIQTAVKEGNRMSGPRLELAQQRVTLAELTLAKAYQQALPVYEEALSRRLGDAANLEAKIEAMQVSLGLAVPE
ncbi:MAG: hypothetical protein JSU72_15320 [Deltaproteobacteria bacterium]|nr:MAG: hypothetical protein JSU72_15320 [Deltaproteobacteria bacterium]